ncbi:MAG: sugar phosphate isomerase/epimerase family protein [Candidatus Woesearchaeota archaeon]
MIFVSTSCLKGEKLRYEPSLKKCFKVFEKIGINKIEIGAAIRESLSEKEILNYKKKNDVEFIIHCLFPPRKFDFITNLGSGNKEIREASFKTAMETVNLCRRLDAELYSLHPGFLSDIDINDKVISRNISKEELLKYVTEALIPLCDKADDYGIKVAIENSIIREFTYFCDIKSFEKILKMVGNKKLGLLVDLGHLRTNDNLGLVNMKEFLNRFKDKIYELHIHSVINDEDHRKITEDPSNITRVPKEILKKAEMTLEVNRLTGEEVLVEKKFLQDYFNNEQKQI